jgi:hypothetical protein
MRNAPPTTLPADKASPKCAPDSARGARLARKQQGNSTMKHATIGLAALALTLGPLVCPAPALAKGCLKGAVVGGVAGHYAGHHGVMGAIGGCIVGHLANEKDKQNAAAAGQTEPAPAPKGD